MIRTLLIFLFTVTVTVFWGTIVIFASFVTKNGNLPHKIARFWAKNLLTAGGTKVTVKGLANIDPAKHYIYMPNHKSNFDIPVLQAYLPVQFRWLAKAELFNIPVFGYAMQRAGYVEIDRSNRAAAIASLDRTANIIKAGMSVIIFPEGTRSRDNTIRPFKKGGFVVAVDTGVPIVPVIIRGTREIMPKNRIQVKPGRVVIEIKAPVQTSSYSRQTKNDLMEKIRNVIGESCEMDYEETLPC